MTQNDVYKDLNPASLYTIVKTIILLLSLLDVITLQITKLRINNFSQPQAPKIELFKVFTYKLKTFILSLEAELQYFKPDEIQLANIRTRV